MRKVKLRKGTILYHGTSAPEDFDMPDGPAWFSQSEAVARKFVGWHTWDESNPRVMRFRVTQSPKLALINDTRELEELMEEVGVEELNYEELHPMSAYGYDGWNIPDNYGPGEADIMILRPDQFLEFLDEYEVKDSARNPGLKPKLDELNRLAQTLLYYHWLKEQGLSWSEVIGIRKEESPKPNEKDRIWLKLRDGRVVKFDHIPFSDDVIFNKPAYTPSENPPPTKIVLARDYYHATPDGDAGESILRSGLIFPRPGKQGRWYQSPRAGFVYMSPQLYYAAIYALGGVFMGHENPEKYWINRGRYGYIFLVHKGDMIDVEPDEDDVGEMATSDLRKRGPNFLKEMAEWDAKPTLARDPKWAKREKLRRAKDGEMAYQSLIGKQLLKRLDRDRKEFLMNISGVNIANRGPVGFDAAWRLDKSRAPEIAEDGSNVLEIAERIT